MSSLAPLARWIADLRYEDIPATATLAARYQIINMLAAVSAARTYPDAIAIHDAVVSTGGVGRSTVLATGSKLSPENAALVNAAYSMAHDFDDIIWMGHTCHSAVFAPLAVAEHEGKDVRALVTAVVVANEIAGRLGASSAFGPQNGQMWTFIHLIGAAAGTAKLLGLDADQTLHALAISLAQPTYALQPGFIGPSSKLLAAGIPTATGIQAAYFARQGVTGAPTILEDRRGFWSKFSFVAMPHMLGELGTTWLIETLTIKSYPGCHYFQTTCEALDGLLREHRVSAGDIDRVDVETTKVACEVTRFGAEYRGDKNAVTSVDVNFDLATTVAVLACAGRLTSREVSHRWLAEHATDIATLASRVTVRHDPALTARLLASANTVSMGGRALAELGVGRLVKLRAAYKREYRSQLISPRDVARWLRVAIRRVVSGPPAESPARGLEFPARVTLHLRDGRAWTRQVDLPAGAFGTPTMEPALRRKLVGEAGNSREAERTFAHALRMEDGSLAELVERCAATIRPELRSVGAAAKTSTDDSRPALR